MNDLEKYFYNNKDRLIHKWTHYFDAYERHFHKYRGKEIVMLEVGVFQGGSLQMWKNYFGERAKIYGVDINPECKNLEEKNIEIFIGSQSDRNFLRQLKKQIPKVDILLDDGGHRMDHQIVTFEELFDHVKEDGVYLCEDIHTSYELFYGGGHKRGGTFVEYSKNFIDYIHAWYSEQATLKISEFTKTVHSLHYYPGMIAIEKGRREKPAVAKTGKESYTVDRSRSLFDNVKKKTMLAVNLPLRYLRLPNIGSW